VLGIPFWTGVGQTGICRKSYSAWESSFREVVQARGLHKAQARMVSDGATWHTQMSSATPGSLHRRISGDRRREYPICSIVLRWTRFLAVLITSVPRPSLVITTSIPCSQRGIPQPVASRTNQVQPTLLHISPPHPHDTPLHPHPPKPSL
jgi:hypothetical protein